MRITRDRHAAAAAAASTNGNNGARPPPRRLRRSLIDGHGVASPDRELLEIDDDALDGCYRKKEEGSERTGWLEEEEEGERGKRKEGGRERMKTAVMTYVENFSAGKYVIHLLLGLQIECKGR